MFWRFGGYANISTIDTILEKPEFSLEDLLEESDLIQELKQHNAKLVEYLREPRVLEKLLEYVVAPKLEPVATPDDDDDEAEGKGKGRANPFSRPRATSRLTDNGNEEEEGEKKRNRYAYVAAEVLSSDNWSISEALLENKQLLRNFWQFLKRPVPLDPLQASYFTKVNESLFDKKTEEMLELLKSLEDAVPDMLKHVDCPMIMDLLLKIISLERTESGQGIVEWLYTQDVMPTLLSFLGPEHSWATQTSAGDFMKAIITVSANASQNEQTCIGPNELTRQLVSKPCVEQLIKYMLGGGNPLTVGVGIVIEVIRKNNSDYDPDVGAESNSLPSSRDPIYLGTLLRLFAQHVPDFMHVIMNAPAQKERLQSTFGDKIEPLGFDRFKTCELMAELLHCSNMGLLNEVGAEELIATRDAERHRMRTEGKLNAQRGEELPSSADDLTMHMSHSSPVDESRRLGVTNVSVDDDGFEEVTHSGDMSEDTSHEFVKAEEEIAPAGPNATLSFLDKDEDDFVDEPLSSPRLNVREADIEAPHFEDLDLAVAPLSPSKEKSAELHKEPEEPEKEKAEAELPEEKTVHISTEEKTDALEVDEHAAGSDKSEDSETPVLTPTISEPEQSKPDELAEPTEPATTGTTSTDSSRDGLSPHPEDTPAPLFSSKQTTIDPAPAGAEEAQLAPPPQSNEDTAGAMDSAANEPEPGEASIIVGHAAEVATDGGTSIEDSDMAPVVGDYLKMQFVEYRVVPTILSFFFSYPWNNFLHNVVYDIVQQVFNGPMDRGFNPTLAISLFESADVTNQIIQGQLASEKSQQATKTRMGYMGHLTLIAEEVVKFTERHPPELLSEMVLDRVMAPDWINYVEGALAETRERDNAILGGVRPEVALNNRAGGGPGAAAGLAAVGLSGLGSALGLGGGSHGGSGGGASTALAEAGLNGGIDLNDTGAGGNGIGPFAISAGTLMSGFGSSSDEEEDEEQEPDTEEDVNNEFRAYTDPLNASTASLNPPSLPPPPPPPPPPLNIPPSRARLQLAARLAMNKRNAQAAAAAAAAATGAGTGHGENGSHESEDSTGLSALKGLQNSPDIVAERLRNPFADEEDEDEDGDGEDEREGSDDGEGDGDGEVGSSGWDRGSWWRGVVRRGVRGGASKHTRSRGSGSGGGGTGAGTRAAAEERFGDGRDNSESSDEEDALALGRHDEDDDDEEFGDFAMPEVVDGREKGVAESSAATGNGVGSSTTISGIDPAREKVLLKPLPVHPASSGKAASGFGSLWPFSTQGFGTAGMTTHSSSSTGPSKSGVDKEPEAARRQDSHADDEGDGEHVLDEDGSRVSRAVEAKRRTSIEDPDDEEDGERVEVGEEGEMVAYGRGR